MFELIPKPSLRIFRFFRSLRKKGYYELRTEFVFGKIPREFQFRTLVYFDGDQTNVIPSIDYFSNNPEWYDIYQHFYRLHTEKVHAFIQDLDHSTRFWGEAIVFPAFLAMNARLFYDLYQFAVTGKPSESLIAWVADMVILVIAILLRKFFVSWGIRIIIRLGMWGAQVYRKRKERKRLKAQRQAEEAAIA